MTKEIEKQMSYRVYVLRSWQEGTPTSAAPAVWRFSLEDPNTRQRRGFADLEALMSFLAVETEKGPTRDSADRNG